MCMYFCMAYTKLIHKPAGFTAKARAGFLQAALRLTAQIFFHVKRAPPAAGASVKTASFSRRGDIIDVVERCLLQLASCEHLT